MLSCSPAPTIRGCCVEADCPPSGCRVESVWGVSKPRASSADRQLGRDNLAAAYHHANGPECFGAFCISFVAQRTRANTILHARDHAEHSNWRAELHSEVANEHAAELPAAHPAPQPTELQPTQLQPAELHAAARRPAFLKLHVKPGPAGVLDASKVRSWLARWFSGLGRCKAGSRGPGCRSSICTRPPV